MPFPALVLLAIVASVGSYVGLGLCLYAVANYLHPEWTHRFSFSDETSTAVVLFAYSLTWLAGVVASKGLGRSSPQDIGGESPFTRRDLKNQRKKLLLGCLVFPLGIVRSLWEAVGERFDESGGDGGTDAAK